MNRVAWFVLVFALVAFAGCNRKNEEEAPAQSSGSEEATTERLGKEIGDVLDAAAKLAAGEKKTYEQKASEELHRLQKQLDEMKPEIKKMSKDGRKQAEKTMEEIQKSIDSMARKLKKEMESKDGLLKSAARELQDSLDDLQNTAGRKLIEIGKALEKETQKLPAEKQEGKTGE